MTEPIRLSKFLRYSCEHNLYGLRYLNQEKTLLKIPWPVVPKNKHNPSSEFQIFQEWTRISFHRRGQHNTDNHKDDSLTNQKHRFRNALSRANGIEFRKDIKIEGAKVVQFTEKNDCHCDEIPVKSTFNSSHPVHPIISHPIPSPCTIDQPFEACTNPPSLSTPPFPNQPPDYTEQFEWKEPTGYIPVSDPVVKAQDFPDRNEFDDIWTLIQNDFDQTEATIYPFQDDMEPFPSSTWSQQKDHQQEECFSQLTAEGSSDLKIKVCFQQDDASRCYVTNSNGCRVFFGDMMPNMTQLLPREHLEDNMNKRIDQNVYFGPKGLQQIKLPSPKDFMKTPTQQRKTEAILQNMGRGVLFYVVYRPGSFGYSLPDVHVQRLCQTRIFPCQELPHNINGNSSPTDGLPRMSSVKIFDGERFLEQMSLAEQNEVDFESKLPIASFSFSLGQRPCNKTPSNFLVCLTVTVLKAEKIIQNIHDRRDREICISLLNSADKEANELASNLSKTLHFNNTHDPNIPF